MKFIQIVFYSLAFGLLMVRSAMALDFDTAKIEILTGAKGEINPATGAFKISLPHKDLKIHTIGLVLTPELGLISWAEFKKVGGETNVIGEMVLLEDQVNPAMKAALDNNLAIKSIHNNYLWESPKLMYLRVEGTGDAKDLAAAIGKVFESIKKTRPGIVGGAPIAFVDQKRTTIDPENLDAHLKQKGVMKNGVYKVVFGSSEPEASWAKFVGTDKHALILGEFALNDNEVQDILKSLAKKDFLVLAVHQQGNNSKLQSVRYVKHGPAMELVKDIKEIVDSIKDIPKSTEVSVKALPPQETLPLEQQNTRLKKLN